MSNLKIELNSAGVQALLKSPEMMEICQQAAEGVKSRYGKGCKVSTYTGKTRVNASVYSDRADNSLLKALR